MSRVGIIGLGLVGSALAERLIGAGWSSVGFDLDPAKNAALAALGGVAAANAAAVFESADCVVLSLPTSEIATAVLREVESQLPGKTILDATTGDPDAMAAVGRRLAEMGCDYLDATIAGSSNQVRRGEVVVMLGGPAAAVARCEPLLAAFAKRWFHLGEWGSGARMKLVVNLVLGLNRAVLAEGLAFAQACGVDPRLALQVLRAGPAFSQVMEIKGERMLRGNFAPEARLAQHAKDVRLILEQARQVGFSLPLSQQHDKLLTELLAAGWGEADNSAIIRAFDRGAE